jgi:hypothetical protein
MFPLLSKPAKVLLKRLYSTIFRVSLPSDRLLYAIDEPRGRSPLRAIRGRCVLRGWAVLRDSVDPPRIRIRVNRSLYPARIIPRGDVREALHRSPPYAEACGFELALQLNRGAHLVNVEVEHRPGAWRALSSEIFLSLGLRRPPAERIDYAAWTALDAAWRPLERTVFEAHQGTMATRPGFEIFIRPGGDPAITRESLARQIYREFTVVDLAAGAAPPEAQDPAGYRLFLRAGDQLTEDALYAFADRINADQAVDVLHGDEDLVDAAGVRQAPFFKPDWSPTYLAGADYLGRAVAYSNRLAYSDLMERTALIASIGADAGRVVGVPRVLLHRPFADAAGLLADAGRTLADPPPLETEASEVPRVLLVLGSNGGQSDPAWVRQSGYPRLEVVRADRESGTSVGPARRPAWLDRGLGSGDILLFIDDDLAPTEPLSIQALVRALRDPVVGAVGPTLVDRASGRRHLGLSNDDGEPGPILDEGLGLAPLTPRNVLGVSRACLATRLEDFVAVGGFIAGLGADLEGLDYCLKLAGRGLFTVHTPHATLDMPRWRPSRPEAITWHQQNWPQSCARDPFYREDALATRPANQVVTMKVANL